MWLLSLESFYSTKSSVIRTEFFLTVQYSNLRSNTSNNFCNVPSILVGRLGAFDAMFLTSLYQHTPESKRIRHF